MRLVIVGNGIAGVNVAAAVKNASPDASVEVFASEPHPLYSRIRLPEVLSGASAPEAITFYKPEWYEKRGIRVNLALGVVSVDRKARAVQLADGRSVSYDRLVLATGASANRPPIPGSDARGVFTMRTLEDALGIRASVRAAPDSASVIGGGLLGLEAARAMKDAGAKEVRVFEIFPRLLPRQLDFPGASLLSARFAAMGIEVVCSAETESFIPDSDDPGRAFAIRLKDGRVFRSSTTILSMGVRPNVELAKACGLEVNRGIVVNEFMRSSDEAIYAVGDCAEFKGVVWGIVPAALEQAPVAARAILASASLVAPELATPYAQTVPKTALKVGDVELMSLGKAVLSTEEEASGRFEERSRVWEGGSRYEKYVLDRGEAGSPATEPVLVGAILYGSKAHQARAQSLTGKAVDPETITALLAD